MSRFVSFATVVVAAVLANSAGSSAADMHQVINADSIKWEAAPPGLPKGAMASVLSGDPGKNELYILRAKLPDGYAVPAHWHSKAENITVLSGTLHIATGEKLDKTMGQAVTAGGFFFMPPQMRHFVWSTGDTVLEISAIGPFDITYVDRNDDPRTATTGAR